MMIDLTVLTTDELVSELSTRFSAIVIAGAKRGRQQNAEQYYWFYNGPIVYCRGLLTYIENIVDINMNLLETGNGDNSV